MKPFAKKELGQHFLSDSSVIANIIDAIRPQLTDKMVEIGPGRGALTHLLRHKLTRLHVIELDLDLIPHLQTIPNLDVHVADALRFDFASLTPCGAPLRVVGNLPYNISTPILFHLLRFSTDIIDLHLMLQKEVVARMVAPPNNKIYGRLSVMLQYRLQLEFLFDVPASAFRPAPQVQSALVRCIPYALLPHAAVDEALFERLVKTAFLQRRKVLRNSLKAWVSEDDFAASAIDGGARAENLTVADFVRLANHLARL